MRTFDERPTDVIPPPTVAERYGGPLVDIRDEIRKAGVILALSIVAGI